MTETALRATTRRSSDLSKHSAEVFAEAEDHPVTVTRRDGEALVLMSQREADSRTRMLQFAAQLIGVAVDDNGPLAERMARAFPWMLALSPADRNICAQDLVDAARASFSTDQPHLVLAELTSWKETATAIAAGLNQGEPQWLDDNEVVVERPQRWLLSAASWSLALRRRSNTRFASRPPTLPRAGRTSRPRSAIRLRRPGTF